MSFNGASFGASKNLIEKAVRPTDEQVKQTIQELATTDPTLFQSYDDTEIKQQIAQQSEEIAEVNDSIFEEKEVTKYEMFDLESTVGNARGSVGSKISFGTASQYRYVKSAVEEGKTYRINTSYWKDMYTCGYCITDSADKILVCYFDTEKTAWTHENMEVTIPTNGAFLYVNTVYAMAGEPTIEEKSTVIEKVNKFIEVEDKKSFATKSETEMMMDKIYSTSLLNPFDFKNFDKGQLTFCLDDANAEHIDLVASIFEEFNIPLCIALIPTKLNVVCKGLTTNKGSFRVGMTVKEVCEKIVELGGEVLSHSYTVITEDNINDYDTMYQQFVGNKKLIEDCDIKVRGIIKSGGPDAITTSTILQKWSSSYYDYSDEYGDGTTPNYYKPRFNMMGRDIGTLKGFVYNYVESAKDWRCMYFHKLESADVSESTLRELLQYVSEKVSNGDFEIGTYSTIYDKFKSTELEKRIIALENA